MMKREELINALIEHLLKEMPHYASMDFHGNRRDFLRALMNLRPPLPLDPDFLKKQDALLQAETQERARITLEDIPPTKDPQLFLWQGDIRLLAVDAIVNAANSALLGCFIPLHACIDNVIHSAAGLQLRRDCHAIIEAQGHEEATGSAKITPAYNLPSRFVLHTVGPIIQDQPTKEDQMLLASCYRSCLELVSKHELQSIAFCSISTGVFRYPKEEAATIAIKTVKDFLQERNSQLQVIFNVFKDEDHEIYRRLLS